MIVFILLPTHSESFTITLISTYVLDSKSEMFSIELLMNTDMQSSMMWVV